MCLYFVMWGYGGGTFSYVTMQTGIYLSKCIASYLLVIYMRAWWYHFSVHKGLPYKVSNIH